MINICLLVCFCVDVYLLFYLFLILPPKVLICKWRASETSETLSRVYKFELVRYLCIYVYIPHCQVVVKFYRDLYF